MLVACPGWSVDHEIIQLSPVNVLKIEPPASTNFVDITVKYRAYMACVCQRAVYTRGGSTAQVALTAANSPALPQYKALFQLG